jgi:hypothetical protein
MLTFYFFLLAFATKIHKIPERKEEKKAQREVFELIMAFPALR